MAVALVFRISSQPASRIIAVGFQEQARPLETSQQIGLGQRRALIGRIGLVADHGDGAVKAFGAQRLDGLGARLAGADNDDVFGHFPRFLQFGRGVTMPAASTTGPNNRPFRAARTSGLKAGIWPKSAQTFRKEFALPDLDATARLGASIARGLAAGDAVALWGDLGAGKTTLARAILAALGVAEDVPSPTFTLVQSYDTRPPVSPLRSLSPEERARAGRVGLDDALADGAVLVEWPERAPEALPPETLHVRLGAQRRRTHGAADRTRALGKPDPCLNGQAERNERFSCAQPAGAPPP